MSTDADVRQGTPAGGTDGDVRFWRLPHDLRRLSIASPPRASSDRVAGSGTTNVLKTMSQPVPFNRSGGTLHYYKAHVGDFGEPAGIHQNDPDACEWDPSCTNPEPNR